MFDIENLDNSRRETISELKVVFLMPCDIIEGLPVPWLRGRSTRKLMKSLLMETLSKFSTPPLAESTTIPSIHTYAFGMMNYGYGQS
jgi:hypothetical protein